MHCEVSGSWEEREFAKWTWQKIEKENKDSSRWNRTVLEAKNVKQVWKYTNKYINVFIYVLVHSFFIL